MPKRTSDKTPHQTNTDRRKEAERLHRRNHILMAAERVFGRLPYDLASMQEVASEAGIGMKGLYEHFSSKEALLSDVIVFRLGEIDEQLKATRKTPDPKRRLRDLAVAYSAFFLERPHFYPLFATQKICADWDLRSRLTEAARQALRQMEAEVVKARPALRTAPTSLSRCSSTESGERHEGQGVVGKARRQAAQKIVRRLSEKVCLKWPGAKPMASWRLRA